jgi:hypothetical protein
MSEPELDHVYPGIDRLHYFLGKVGMIAAAIFVVTVFGPGSPVMKVLSLVLMIASTVLDVMRLRNIGLSQWFMFVRFLPFGNTALTIGLLCAQTGWIETRRLDRAGRSILIFELLLLALMLFMFFRLRMLVPFYF